MTKQRHSSLDIHPGAPRGVRRVQTWHRMRSGFVILFALLLLAAAVAMWRNQSQAKALAASASKQAVVTVNVVHPEPAGASQTLPLPGTLLGMVESPISARASGYLTSWTKDIGAPVKKGELLAQISSPEVDQQLAQAIAARQQTVSSLNLAKNTLDRWKGLLEQRAVSQQEYDERRSAYEQAVATLASADANIQRLKELLSFTRVLAPFDGVITKRNVNVGDLIDANAGKPLFVLTQATALRAYVYVPQAYSRGVQVGQRVRLTQAELPGQGFRGTVTRTAKAIDPVSRSLQVEIGVDNVGGQLLPGSYVQVEMPLSQRNGLTLPVNTLLMRGEGPRVGVVDDKGRVKLAPVELGKDFGMKVEVLSGVTAADRVVLNPPDGLEDGDKLSVVEKPAGKQASGK
jgi:RND family efflux transporter MFP subunit